MERLDLRDQWHTVGNYTNCFDCQRPIIAIDIQAPNGPVIFTDPKLVVCPKCQSARNKKFSSGFLVRMIKQAGDDYLENHKNTVPITGVE